jgi:TatD DNase family protein
MKYIDIHGHINFPDYDKDREEVFKRAADAEVGMIIVGTDLESSKKCVELAQGRQNVWATVGVHPTGTPRPTLGEQDIDFSILKELAKDPKVVAIGECGLDYFHSKPEDIAKQKKVFEQHIALANEVGKPLMLHVRNGKDGSNAYQEALSMLKLHAEVRANFHFFAGTKMDAFDIIAMNNTVSFTGVLTFTEDYIGVIRTIPSTHMMSETDCPFVAPVPYRGKRNEPVYVVEVIKAIARIRNEEENAIAEQILWNAATFFGLQS